MANSRRFLAPLLVVLVASHLSVTVEIEEDVFQMALQMPAAGTSAPKHNDYRCRALELPTSDSYIVSYEPQADPNIVHHMLVYGCGNLRHGLSDSSSWSCKSETVCGPVDVPKTIYAWALNASGFQLPPGVGQKLGPSVNINYLVVQIHYGELEGVPSPVTTNTDTEQPLALILHMTLLRQERMSGVFLIASGTRLSPGKEEVTTSIACQFPGPKTIVPLAFRTHAHTHCTLIVGYVGNGRNKWTEIGFRSPQDPQAFYPVTNDDIAVNPGDWVAARCVYNTSGGKHPIHMGPNSEDEMCNFYLMYHTENDGQSLTKNDCWDPPGSNVHFPPLPTLPTLTPSQGHHHDHSLMEGGADEEIEIIGSSQTPITSFDEKTTSSSEIDEETVTEDDGEEYDYMCPSSIPPGQVPSQCTKNGNENVLWDLVIDEQWPYNGVDYPHFDTVTGMGGALGQVTSVAVATDGSVYILHRGSRVWDSSTFSYTNIFADVADGPISTPTVLKLSGDGTLQETWGAGIFYLPHSVTLDESGGLWFTDVALHQVLKFDGLDSQEPSLTLGHELTPGAKPGYFCKPADVAVASSGKFYVADGYCNSRVVAYDANGMMSTILGNFPIEKERLFVPHSLALNPSQDRLFIADRENHRIVSIDVLHGDVKVLSAARGLGRVFGVGFSGLRDGGWPLVAVSNTDDGESGYGVTLDQEGAIENVWGIQQRFKNVHDVAVDTANKAVYATELTPPRIWRFLLVNGTPSDGGAQTPLSITEEPQSTTLQPPTATTERPQGTTVQPPTATTQTIEQQSPSVPQSTTEQPQTTTEQATTTMKGPDTTTNQPPPSTTEHAGPTTEQRPETATQRPHDATTTTPTTKPSATTSSLATDQPPNEDFATLPTTTEETTPTTNTTTTVNSTEGDQSSSADGVDADADAAVGSNATEATYRFTPKPNDPIKTPVYHYGLFAAIFAIVGLILVVVIGILKEHFYCRFRPRRRRSSAVDLKSQSPREALHSLLGPPKLGFSRLRTYDSDSEVEEFPIFSRQS